MIVRSLRRRDDDNDADVGWSIKYSNNQTYGDEIEQWTRNRQMEFGAVGVK